MKTFSRYWGYVLAAMLAALWWSSSVGPAALLLVSGVVTVYFAFAAPLWCGATTRGGKPCRNNAYGVLMGCHYQEHRWQKLKLAVVPRQWRNLNAELWTSPKVGLASLGAILGIVSTLVSSTMTIAKAVA
jgi:hypothetical protein